MARSWVIDGKAIANKVKNASLPSASQIKDSGATRECPHCNNLISNIHVSQEWPGLPAGVKFEPSDSDLIQHLAAKCGVGKSEPNVFLDDFIPTISTDEGICYTHPENLPGAKKDGSSIHFFHRIVNAYATGQRKRRKIQSEQVRWHKTGKTKPVIENGVQRGCKKILVLYKSAKRGCKPHKANWVMHQYHLGTEEDEQDGYYVVSKIFYQQPKHSSENNDLDPVAQDSEIMSLLTSPRTPSILNPPPRAQTDMFAEDHNTLSYAKEGESYLEAESGYVPNTVELDTYGRWLAGESEGLDGIDEALLLCKELSNSNTHKSDQSVVNSFNNSIAGNVNNDAMGSNNMACGINDLVNIQLDTPPDFKLAELQFGSQDSVFDWIDHL